MALVKKSAKEIIPAISKIILDNIKEYKHGTIYKSSSEWKHAQLNEKYYDPIEILKQTSLNDVPRGLDLHKVFDGKELSDLLHDNNSTPKKIKDLIAKDAKAKAELKKYSIGKIRDKVSSLYTALIQKQNKTHFKFKIGKKNVDFAGIKKPYDKVSFSKQTAANLENLEKKGFKWKTVYIQLLLQHGIWSVNIKSNFVVVDISGQYAYSTNYTEGFSSGQSKVNGPKSSIYASEAMKLSKKDIINKIG
jgi:hypothetical protein